MAVFRVEKNKNYITISNYHLRDMNLSLKAKGLLSLMLSLPDNWDYSIGGLAAICKEGREAIESALKELKIYGYLKVSMSKNEKGQFDYIYDIFERPAEDKPGDGNPRGENPPTENPEQLNIDKINIDNKNTEIIKEKNTKKEKSTKITALEALEGFKEEFNLSDELTETFKDFIEMRKEIKDPITVNGLKRAINTLFKLSADPGEQLEIINQSIIAGYKGLFPLKPYQRQGAYQPQRAPEPKEEEDALTRVRKRLEAEEAARKAEEEKSESGLLSEE